MILAELLSIRNDFMEYSKLVNCENLDTSAELLVKETAIQLGLKGASMSFKLRNTIHTDAYKLTHRINKLSVEITKAPSIKKIIVLIDMWIELITKLNKENYVFEEVQK